MGYYSIKNAIRVHLKTKKTALHKGYLPLEMHFISTTFIYIGLIGELVLDIPVQPLKE